MNDEEYNLLKQELKIKGRNYKPLIHKIIGKWF